MAHTKYDILEHIHLWILIVMIGVLIGVLICLIYEEVHSAELDIGLNYLSGQHDTRNLNLGVKVPIFNEAALLTSKVRYGEHDDVIVQNQGYFRLGYDPELSEKWSLWFYEQVGYDKPKNIDFESFSGGGLKYTFFYQTDDSKASGSLGYLYHWQEHKQINRLSLRLKGKTKLQLIDLTGVFFYQPNIEDFQDYLASGEVGLSFSLKGLLELNILNIAMIEDLRLKLSVEDYYRSMLDEPNELLTSLSLVVEF